MAGPTRGLPGTYTYIYTLLYIYIHTTIHIYTIHYYIYTSRAPTGVSKASCHESAAAPPASHLLAALVASASPGSAHQSLSYCGPPPHAAACPFLRTQTPHPPCWWRAAPALMGVCEEGGSVALSGCATYLQRGTASVKQVVYLQMVWPTQQLCVSWQASTCAAAGLEHICSRCFPLAAWFVRIHGEQVSASVNSRAWI